MKSSERLEHYINEAKIVLLQFETDMMVAIERIREALGEEIYRTDVRLFRRLMSDAFDRGETDMLMFELGITESIEDGTLEEVHKAIVCYFDRRNEMPRLADCVRGLRPKIDWPCCD